MSTAQPHKPYPSDVSNDEWEFVAPYLTLMTPDALQRTYALRDVFNAVRWLARFRRLARDYERLPSVLAELHYLSQHIPVWRLSDT